ncbi:MAG: M67 family metallopeptidase [Altererythrobacter sp.]
MRISQNICCRVLAEADRAHPRECCGILLGEGDRITGVSPATNVHPTPETHFEIDPQALVDAHRAARAGGAQVVGYYHSHPNGFAEPSATDRAAASGDGRIWLIIAAGSINGWKDTPDGFERVSLHVNHA